MTTPVSSEDICTPKKVNVTAGPFTFDGSLQWIKGGVIRRYSLIFASEEDRLTGISYNDLVNEQNGQPKGFRRDYQNKLC